MKLLGKKSNKTKDNYDKELLEYIQPQGGIKYNIDHVRTGTGYETCIQIYEFPTWVEAHWLTDVCYFEGAITTVDITTENPDAALQNIGRSLKEQRGRANTDRNDTGVIDSVDAYGDYNSLYEQVKRGKAVLKSIIVRIYIRSHTLNELEKKEERILNRLDSYKGAVMLNEQKQEWKALHLPYKEQQKFDNARIGIPMIDEAIAAGDPFHFSYLHDPDGIYLGSTACGGTINFNMFHKTILRKYYNVLLLGSMGSGKSTILKKLGHNAYILGDYVRLFDVTGELDHMSEVCGWKKINLDGTDGIYNMFQILKVHADEGVCYSLHISKLETIYKLLAEESNSQELITFKNLVNKLYIETGIVTETINEESNITGYSADRYFTISDFIAFCYKELENLKNEKPLSAVEESLMISEAEQINNIKRLFESVKNSYGNILDGHTSVENIMDIKGVVYNIKNIAALPANIGNTLLFITLSTCWDNCTRNGMIQKKLYEEGKIGLNDIEHFLIEFDEAHKIMNARYPVAIQQLTDMQREMRKVFGGLLLATQLISECMPDDASAENVQKIKDLFALSNYKFIGNQDTSLIPKLKEAFGNTLSNSEYERIPKLGQGQFILSIQGDQNIEFNVYASRDELDLFRGGM